MAWHDDEWRAFCLLMDQAWPGEFADAARTAYRVLLDGTEPAAIVEALRRLLHRGQRFRPSAAELLGELRADPTRPTFAEAYRLIFGHGGALRARPPRGARWGTEGERRLMRHGAIGDRAADLHPLVAAFIDRQGIDRLAALPLDDPDWGERHRRDLERAWDQHVDALDGRDVAALAIGRSGRGELAHLDPLTALGIERPAELEHGEAA